MNPPRASRDRMRAVPDPWSPAAAGGEHPDLHALLQHPAAGAHQGEGRQAGQDPLARGGAALLRVLRGRPTLDRIVRKIACDFARFRAILRDFTRFSAIFSDFQRFLVCRCV